MRFQLPDTVMVEASVAESELVRTLRRNLPGAAFSVVEQVGDGNPYHPRTLEVVRFRGRFLKDCPGTRHYHCCGYQILHFGMQCTLGCSYCVLQAYLNQPNLRLFGNTGRMFTELIESVAAEPGRIFRVGTGEFTDSLLLDPWTRFSRRLVPTFARLPNAVLELKTKTPFIADLEDLDHGGHTLAAWSLNARPMRRSEEARTATLEERLRAARQVADWGYWLAFHFDPMIEYPGWEAGYGEVLDLLFDAVDPARVVWISLGTFRFMPEFKSIMLHNHPGSDLPYGEFVRGLDGKMRYFRDIRTQMYAFMVERIRRVDPGICVYLCMEGTDVWRDAFGFAPQDRGGLPAMLDRVVRDRMKVGPGA